MKRLRTRLPLIEAPVSPEVAVAAPSPSQGPSSTGETLPAAALLPAAIPKPAPAQVAQASPAKTTPPTSAGAQKSAVPGTVQAPRDPLPPPPVASR
jgi:hypothetical protein